MKYNNISNICLYNPKFSENIGSVMRAAHCFEVNAVSIVGQRFKKSCLDTAKSHRHIPVFQSDDENSWMNFIPYDCTPVAIECGYDNSICLTDFAHPKRAFYIFGPEDGSLPENIVNDCKYIVKIPTKMCLNLAMSVNVVLYDRELKIKKGWSWK